MDRAQHLCVLQFVLYALSGKVSTSGQFHVQSPNELQQGGQQAFPYMRTTEGCGL